MLIRSPVTKNMQKSVRASVVPQKQRLLKSDATIRDAREVLSESQFDTETMCFDEEKRDKLLSDAVNKELDESVFSELESLGNGGLSLGDIGCNSINVEK